MIKAMYKYCKYCKSNKLLTEFRYHKCKDCKRNDLKKAMRNPDMYAFKYRRLYKLRYRAKHRGIFFDLKIDKCYLFYIPQKCFYCGVHTEKPTVDRKNNDVGYIQSNCVSCCSRCNRIKYDLTKKDIHIIKKIISVLE